MFDEPPTLSGDIRERYEYDVYGGCIVHTDAGQDGQWMTADDTTDTESGAGNPYMFTGRRYDPESGLYYYRARYYSAEIGRFLQPDRLGYYSDLNLYTYVWNNPINVVDPKGLLGMGTVICGAVCGGFGGGFIYCTGAGPVGTVIGGIAIGAFCAIVCDADFWFDGDPQPPVWHITDPTDPMPPDPHESPYDYWLEQVPEYNNSALGHL